MPLMYLATFVIGIILALQSNTSASISFIYYLTIFVYGLLFFGTCALSIILSIIRFKNNIFKKEGYLTNVLPVKIGTQIMSKTISAVIWQIFTIIFAGISLLITLMVAQDSFNLTTIVQCLKFLGYGISAINASNIGQVLSCFGMLLGYALISVVGIINYNLLFYAAIATGYSFNEKKTLLSFIAFIVYYVVSQIINIFLVKVYLYLTHSMGISVLNQNPFSNSTVFLTSFVPLLALCLLYVE